MKAVQRDDEPLNKVTFTFLRGTTGAQISPRTGVGVAVKYAVEYADSIDFSGKKSTAPTEGTEKASVSVELPTDTNKKVRYYRPKFTFK